MEIGKIIKENRSLKQLTQEELAQEFFVSRQLISKWENGKSYPDLEQLLKLSDFFDLTLDELLRGDKKMVSKISNSVKKKRIMIGIILFLASIIVGMGYFYWSQQVIFLNPDEIEVVSINKIKIPKQTMYDSTLKKEILIPEDVKYQIEIESNKKFVKINQAEVFGTLDIDDENIYVYVQAQPTIFNLNSQAILSIEANPKIVSSENEVKIITNNNKAIRILDVTTYKDSEDQIDHSLKWIEKEKLQ